MGGETDKAGNQVGRHQAQPDPGQRRQRYKRRTQHKISEDYQPSQETCCGSEEIPAEGQADAQGIQHRVIVRPGIVIDVDGGNGDLHHGDVMALAVEEHIGLVFVPPPGNVGECRQAGGRDSPQPGLGVPERDPAQAIQQKSHGPIPAFALGRYLGAGKVPPP